MIALLQSEFPLRVVVCAWCKPKKGFADLGKKSGPISHGICPGHLKKLKPSWQMKKEGRLLAPADATHSRRHRADFQHPELNYQA